MTSASVRAVLDGLVRHGCEIAQEVATRSPGRASFLSTCDTRSNSPTFDNRLAEMFAGMRGGFRHMFVTRDRRLLSPINPDIITHVILRFHKRNLIGRSCPFPITDFSFTIFRFLSLILFWYRYDFADSLAKVAIFAFAKDLSEESRICKCLATYNTSFCDRRKNREFAIQ